MGRASDPKPNSNGATLDMKESASNIEETQACVIREVWASNLEDEFKIIREVVGSYKYIAMDTEYPGIVARADWENVTPAEYQYQNLKSNVDILKIIQLGLTFMDKDGNRPPGFSTWQFNFQFSLAEDTHAEDSIELLKKSGIQFQKHENEGIDPFEFAQLLTGSGVVMMDDVTIITFQGAYDFGYLLRMLTGENELPADEHEFMDDCRMYFPAYYDVKYLMKSCATLRGGLQVVATRLEVERIGNQHQAGSDSLVTGGVFFKMREMFFENCIDDTKYLNRLEGPGMSMTYFSFEREG